MDESWTDYLQDQIKDQGRLINRLVKLLEPTLRGREVEWWAGSVVPERGRVVGVDDDGRLLVRQGVESPVCVSVEDVRVV